MVSMNGESDAPPKIVRWQHQLLHEPPPSFHYFIFVLLRQCNVNFFVSINDTCLFSTRHF